MSQELTLFDFIPQERPEEWRPVRNFPGYDVSDLGRVRTWWRKGKGNRPYISDRCKIMKTHLAGEGYPMLTLVRKGRRHKRYIHHLVLEAFAGPCPKGMEARHVGCNDKTDNRKCNLAWGTKIQNAQDRHLHGTYQNGTNNPCAKLTAEQVRWARAVRTIGLQIKYMASLLGVNVSNLSRMLNGHRYQNVGEPCERRRDDPNRLV